ncbi:MAG: glutathione S-transferase family protein [Pleurocapsa sp.]
MLKFFYKKLSLYSRSVWITLLEKQISFEPIELSLNGDQWQPEFLAINPFGRVPVIVNNNFSIFESLAILDYLELQYPNPAFLPIDIETITIVQMIKMLAMHELVPAMLTIIRVVDNEIAIQQANQQIMAMLSFLEKHLIGNSYLAGDRITYADVVAGSLILWLPYLNITLSNYPRVEIWSNRLMQRSAWQRTQPSPEIIQNWLKRIQKLPQVRKRQWQQRKQNSIKPT